MLLFLFSNAVTLKDEKRREETKKNKQKTKTKENFIVASNVILREYKSYHHSNALVVFKKLRYFEIDIFFQRYR